MDINVINPPDGGWGIAAIDAPTYVQLKGGPSPVEMGYPGVWENNRGLKAIDMPPDAQLWIQVA